MSSFAGASIWCGLCGDFAKVITSDGFVIIHAFDSATRDVALVTMTSNQAIAFACAVARAAGHTETAELEQKGG